MTGALGRRIREMRSGDTLRVIIGPRRNWLHVLFAVFAAIGLSIAIQEPARDIISGKIPLGPTFFVCACFCGALAIVGMAVLNALWVVWGIWEIVITNKTITTTRTLFSFVRSESFDRSDIRNLRLNEIKSGKGLIFRSVCIDYRGELKHLTPRVSEDEGYALMMGPLNDLEQ